MHAHINNPPRAVFLPDELGAGQAIVEILSSTADRLLRNDDEGIDRDTANAQAELKNVVRQAAAKQPTPIVAVAASSIID